MRSKGMGSNRLISLKEAAELLGVVPRTVHHHVRRGHLHPRYCKTSSNRTDIMFDRDEVAAAAEMWRSEPTLSNLMVRSVQAYALARGLERRVQNLEELIGAKHLPLPSDESTVRSIYLEACDDLKTPPADPTRIRYWATTFMRVGEEFFDALEAYTNNEKSWEAFYDLSRAIVEELPQAEYHPELDEAYRAFEAGRRNLRSVLFFYTQDRFGPKRASQLFQEDVNAHEKILRFLTTTNRPN